jgi:hypothetical protein
MVVKLKSKSFATSDELTSWANGKIAVTDIISITVYPSTVELPLVIFYKKEEA